MISLRTSRIFGDILMSNAPELTPRELQVVRLLAEGHNLTVLVYKLGISKSTVKKHMHSIGRKWNVSGRTQIVYTAYCRGIVR